MGKKLVGSWLAAWGTLAAAGCSDNVDEGRAPPPPAPEPLVHRLALGADATFATGGIKAYAWGAPTDRPGDKKATDTDVPAPVAEFSQVVASPGRTCAWREGGPLFCRGVGAFGALGTGRIDDQLAFEPSAIDDPLEVGLGLNHGCALRRDRSVWCWGGSNARVRGGSIEELLPVPILGQVRAFAVGGGHACAAREDGLFCWGALTDTLGGDPDPEASDGAPVRVPGIEGVRVRGLAAGHTHTCAWLDDDTVWCWGKNGHGQLGDGTGGDRKTPVQVVGLPAGVRGVRAAVHGSCALYEQGPPYCWGGIDATWGDSLAQIHATATPLGVEGDVTDVQIGDGHVCIARGDGSIACWGRNDHGQAGSGRMRAEAPVLLTPSLGPVEPELLAGSGQTCARREAGDVVCWGDNRHLEFGDGDPRDRRPPTRSGWLSGKFMALGLAGRHGCAAYNDHWLWCWGGDAGEKQATTLETEYAIRSFAVSPALGACVVDTDGKLHNVLRLLDGREVGWTGVSMCAALDRNVCAATDGGVQCVGSLGDANPLPAGSDVRQLVAGRGHACALLGPAGQVACFGQNDFGQLGTDGPAHWKDAVIALPAGATTVAVGNGFTCAALAAGGVVCWGEGGTLQLGSYAHTRSATPVAVLPPTVHASRLVAGDAHACAATDTGELWCWGRNESYQVRTPPFGFEPEPLEVYLPE